MDTRDAKKTRLLDSAQDHRPLDPHLRGSPPNINHEVSGSWDLPLEPLQTG